MVSLLVLAALLPHPPPTSSSPYSWEKDGVKAQTPPRILRRYVLSKRMLPGHVSPKNALVIVEGAFDHDGTILT